jgi:hypothetical protein
MAVGNHDLTLTVAGCRRQSSRAAGAIWWYGLLSTSAPPKSLKNVVAWAAIEDMVTKIIDGRMP